MHPTRLRLAAGIAVTLAVLPLAPTALARPALGAASGLLPSAVPSVCIGGIVLCSPLPLPSNPVTGPLPLSSASPAVPQPTPQGNPTAPPGVPPPAVPGGPGAGGLAIGAPLPGPPGVGLVAVPRGGLDGGRVPDSVATVLSLSMRDGLAPGGYRVWPYLLAIQLVLWALIAGAAWWRRSTGSTRPGRR